MFVKNTILTCTVKTVMSSARIVCSVLLLDEVLLCETMTAERLREVRESSNLSTGFLVTQA